MKVCGASLKYIFFTFFCRVTRRSHGLRSAVRAVSQKQDRCIDQRDPSPVDKPEPHNPSTTVPPSPRTKELCRLSPRVQQATASSESSLIPDLASNSETEPCVDLCSQLPLPGRRRVGGRLGVSFCFSRRGPKLEPSASVFSDLEEDESEKKEQMRERIKCIFKDIDREIGAEEEWKHRERTEQNSDSVGLRSMGPIPRESASEDIEIEKRDLEKEHSAISSEVLDNQSNDSLFFSAQESTCGTALAETYTGLEFTDSQTKNKSETAGDSQYIGVVGKEGSTQLRWPVSLLKFTKFAPHISYSCKPLHLNPHDPEQLTDKPHEQNPLCAPSSEPAILAPDVHSCLQRQTGRELVHRQGNTEEAFKAEPLIDRRTQEHLLLKDKTPTLTAKGTEKQTLSTGKCTEITSHSFDPEQIDNYVTNTLNPPGGRLRGASGTTEKAITALRCKLESVTGAGAQRTGIGPTRCEGNCETIGASVMQRNVGVAKVPRKKRTRKHKLGKRSRRKKEKLSNKRQAAMCKVRSVISTVPTCKVGRGEAGGHWGKRKTGRERAGSSCLLGRCERAPVSVSVRRRRPHRSRAEKRCGVYSQPRHDEQEGHRQTVTFPWRSHFSLRSFSPGCNSKMVWERGHHSNPRSFIDCCYPDNCNGNGPARKRKLLHRDRKSIHSKRKNLRHCEEARGRKLGEGRDRGFMSDAEQWEWTNRACPSGSEEISTKVGWRSGNRFVEWHQPTRLSPSPSSWGRGGRGDRHVSTEDMDWDKCSLDRWTCGSSDSWEDEGTHRSRSGSRKGSPGCTWFSGNRQSSSRPFSSPEWWTTRQTSSPQSVCTTRFNRGQSPRSCSPCGSTSLSELSWEWSQSSTCSGISMDKLTVSSGKTFTAASVSVSQETKSISSPTSTASSLSASSCSNSTPQRHVLTVNNVSTSPCELNKTHSHVAYTSSNSRGIRPELCTSHTLFQKPTRTLHLPLIGKLPAIQRKARMKKWLIEKSKEKGGKEMGEEGKIIEAEMNNQDTVYELSASSSLNLRANDKETAVETAPPVSFTAEEMDKYRVLQEQARKHMQKVLELTQDHPDTNTKYTDGELPEDCRTVEEQYIPLLNVPQPRALHPDSMQTQAQHSLQLPLPLTHDNYTQPLPLPVPNLPPLPSPPPLSNLHHIILPLPASPSPSPTASSSPALHPAQLSLHPIHPHLPHHVHLSPISVSSLFPSILLSHRPIPLLPPSPAFHTTPLSSPSPVALQPLTPQPFMDRVWSVRFQQKAL